MRRLLFILAKKQNSGIELTNEKLTEIGGKKIRMLLSQNYDFCKIF
jgi:hypothetical protein